MLDAVYKVPELNTGQRFHGLMVLEKMGFVGGM